MQGVVHVKVAGLQKNFKHFLQRPDAVRAPGSRACLILDAEKQKWEASWRVSPLLPILNGVLNQIVLDLLFIKFAPLQFNVQNEDVLREVFNEVDESVQGHLVQAILCESHLVLFDASFVTQLTAP